MASREREKDKSKVHKLSLKGSAKLVAEFVSAGSAIAVCQKVNMLTQPGRLAVSSNTRYIPYCTILRTSITSTSMV